jgi:hypothetical protein
VSKWNECVKTHSHPDKFGPPVSSFRIHGYQPPLTRSTPCRDRPDTRQVLGKNKCQTGYDSDSSFNEYWFSIIADCRSSSAFCS